MGLHQSNGQPIITFEAIEVTKLVEEPIVTRAQAPSYLKNFDLSKLDSIQSLTVFYAIFKNFPLRI